MIKESWALDPIEPNANNITEVKSAAALNEILRESGAQADVLNNKPLSDNLSNLINRAAEIGKKLFTLRIENKLWAVIASSKTDLEREGEKIRRIAQFQNTVIANKLWAMCIEIHEFANASGVSDGNLTAAAPSGQERPIYNVGST